MMNDQLDKELKPLKDVLCELRNGGKILVAVLYGSYANGTPHKRSDIDLAVFIKARDEKEEMDIIDKILTSTERQIALLRLNDEDESPFVIQDALKGIHLVTADEDTLYEVAHRVLHSAEEIRFRRLLSGTE
ncbi:MAG: nucleotidyltransferase protein [Candidatus Brocadiaceae bacterium]|nr:nucleotidyltransferase protein [Candidatus Brocadiaceae bacterium]MBM2833935.1 nucleotidyltransferase protein [Candidatus Brocadiaceae bacterium]